MTTTPENLKTGTNGLPSTDIQPHSGNTISDLETSVSKVTHKAAAHTPGPWIYIEGRGSIRTGYKNSESTCIAQTNWMLRKNRWAENDANARLIAAAPEMLVEIDSAYTQLDNFIHTGIADLRLVRDKLGAISKKAKGAL